MAKQIVVTGGNDGIGFALCRQLAVEEGCKVFLGARNQERGEKAVASIEIPAGCKGSVELLICDVGDDASVAAAAATVKSKLGGEKLYGLVNNAGIGLQAQASEEVCVNTNLYGPKRMVDAFLPLINPDGGRIVNVGSGAGSIYVKGLDPKDQPTYCICPENWAHIERMLKDPNIGVGTEKSWSKGYGISKALLALYTMVLAKEHPKIWSSCVSPGFIDTKIVTGWGATKPPEEGTVSIKQGLFGALKGNGYYYGSDAVRSPYHFMRNPGEPEYDGTPPAAP